MNIYGTLHDKFFYIRRLLLGFHGLAVPISGATFFNVTKHAGNSVLYEEYVFGQLMQKGGGATIAYITRKSTNSLKNR